MTSFFVQPSTLRPDFRLVISFLWGDSANVYTDGDAENPTSNDWTELYCINRENEREAFDVFPVLDQPFTLEICSEIPELAARVAYFLARSTESRVASSRTGPWQEIGWLIEKVGDFDLAEGLGRVQQGRWSSATLDNPYPASD
jgi:hypothetical protein